MSGINGYIALANLICIIAAGAGGYGLGSKTATARADAAIAQLQKAQADAETEWHRQANIELNAAIERGNTLSRRLSEAESALHKKNLEVHHEIEKATSGRACLSADVVRMLNRAGELPEAAGVPGAAGVAPAEGGAAAGHTTDTMIAHWIANTKTQYGICRERLNNLIDWHERADK